MNCASAVAAEIYVADTGRIRLEKDIADCGRLTKFLTQKNYRIYSI